MAGFDSGFEQGPEDDPFAGSEESFGLSEEERQAAEQANDAAMEAEAPGAAQAGAEPPVVDREGQPVETTADGSPAAAQGAGVDPEPTEQAAEQAQPAPVEEAASEAAAAPIAQAEKAEPPEAPEVEAATEEQAEVEATQVAAEQAAGAVAEQTAEAEAEVEAEQASADPPEPEASPSSAEPGAEAGGESAGEDAGGASADAAEQPTEGKGKRRYLLFTPEGDGRFREVEWYEKNGKSVPKGTAGAKKQKVLLARGQEDALRFGHEILGAPQEGSSLVAVAASYFQVRKVKPDAVPVRQRLKIS